VEKHPEAIFGTDQATRMESTSSLQDAAPTIVKMQELASRGLKGSKEWDRLQEKLTAHFSKRSGGGFASDD
jgi:hypothetical protein